MKIVGDIHGQFNDLRKIFDMEGWPPEANYLFLGDYQGRGPMQVETVLLLLAFKVKYPENFFLLRGNHEDRNVNRYLGFGQECAKRLGEDINDPNSCFAKINEAFENMPLAAIVTDRT